VTATSNSRRKAYEAIAAELRQQIVLGQLANGSRLPNENSLAEQYGVSRATIREALRLLAAQDLIRTAKGAGGGSYVQVPTVHRISEFLESSINLLSSAERVTFEELLEARALLEVPAARLAAQRRAEEDVERLHAATHEDEPAKDADAEFRQNADFHRLVLEACGNTLLTIAAQPIFTVLMTGFARSSLSAKFHRAVRAQHLEIADAIAKGDPDLAGEVMASHLEYLRPTYARLWEQARKRKQS
jgi:DNA-binding FadR family transcriptional regulator